MTKKNNNIHDVVEVVSALRDNLAQHDKPISFLFGAGTSCSVRTSDPSGKEDTVALIPAVEELTDDCKNKAKELGEKFEDAWTMIEKECNTAGQDANIENILSRLRMILQVIGEEKLLGLDNEEISKLEKCIRNNIADRVSPNLENLPLDFPHRKFSKWLVRTSRNIPVEIFTLNYDVLFEYALESEQIPFFDGFVGGYQPFFSAECVQRLSSMSEPNWIKLWKMHGSVTWHRIEQNGSKRIIRGSKDKEGEMIYPSHQKYDESRQQPYSSFADRLRKFLDIDGSLLIVCGYSFGDEHINQIIFGALENKPRTHVYTLQYGDLVEDDILYNYATKLQNLVVIGRSTGMIGCQYIKWQSTPPPAHLANIMKIFYDDNEENSETSNVSAIVSGGEKNGDDVKLGEDQKINEKKSLHVTIGDFSSFCNFLSDMAPDNLNKG